MRTLLVRLGIGVRVLALVLIRRGRVDDEDDFAADELRDAGAPRGAPRPCRSLARS